MPYLVGLIIFLVVTYFLIKILPTPPPIEIESQLVNKGLSPKEVRKELKAQRAEHRAHNRAMSNSLRTAHKMGKFAVSLTKKLK